MEWVICNILPLTAIAFLRGFCAECGWFYVILSLSVHPLPQSAVFRADDVVPVLGGIGMVSTTPDRVWSKNIILSFLSDYRWGLDR
jgi:hypothetical protein